MQTVIGAFDDRQQAEQAVQRLTQLGIAREDVHVEQKDQPAGVPQTKTSTTQVASGAEGEHHAAFSRDCSASTRTMTATTAIESMWTSSARPSTGAPRSSWSMP